MLTEEILFKNYKKQIVVFLFIAEGVKDKYRLIEKK